MEARRKQKFLSFPEYHACRYSILLSNSVELPLLCSRFSLGDTTRRTACAETGAFPLGSCHKTRDSGTKWANTLNRACHAEFQSTPRISADQHFLLFGASPAQNPLRLSYWNTGLLPSLCHWNTLVPKSAKKLAQTPQLEFNIKWLKTKSDEQLIKTKTDHIRSYALFSASCHHERKTIASNQVRRYQVQRLHCN